MNTYSYHIDKIWGSQKASVLVIDVGVSANSGKDLLRPDSYIEASLM
jgi:hypothetical protein